MHLRCCRPATLQVHNTRGCKYSLDAPDDERNYRSKHVEQPRNNKLSYSVASCWSILYIISYARKHEYQVQKSKFCLLLTWKKAIMHESSKVAYSLLYSLVLVSCSKPEALSQYTRANKLSHSGNCWKRDEKVMKFSGTESTFLYKCKPYRYVDNAHTHVPCFHALNKVTGA
jgi:hypothetical protein